MEDQMDIFRDIYENSPIGIFIFDRKGKLTDANQKAMEITGTNSLKYLHNYLTEYPLINSKKNELLNTGKINFQAPLKFTKINDMNSRKSGEYLFDVTVSTTKSGYIMQIQDVTGQKNTNELLLKEQRSRNRLETLINTIPAGVVILEPPEGKITFINDRAREIYAKDPTGLNMGEHTQILKLNGTNYLPEEIPAIRSLKQGEMVLNEDLVIINDDGKQVFISASSAPVYIDGKIASVIGIFEDFTIQKITEEYKQRLLEEQQNLTEELQTSNEELQLTTEELQTANEELQSTTEELQTANEELQSTKDELQAANNGLKKQRLELIKLNIDLRVSEKKYRNIIEHLQDAFIQTDSKGRIIMASPSAGEIFGYQSTEEMFGMPIINLYKKSGDRDRLLEILKKEGKTVDYEINGVKRDGTTFSMSLNAQYRLNDKDEIIGTEVFVRDITFRKNAEKILRKSRTQFKVLIHNLKSGVALIDETSTFLVVNPSFMNLFGLDPEMNILSVNSQDWSNWKVYGEDNELIHVDEHPVFKAVSTGRTVLDQMVGVQNPGGDDITWMLVSAEPILNKDGTINMTICTYYDITERKLIESELKETVKKLALSNQELEQFAYVASHDLQEPLRMVSSFTQLLEMKYRNRLDEEADEYIGFIVEGSVRMKKLIDDLLAFSRLNTRKQRFEQLNMEMVLSDVCYNLKSSIDENDVKIDHNHLPTVRADPSQINQLMQNLISNAIKFRGDESPIINVSYEELDDHWMFSVKDNGIGIMEEHQDKIFEIFRRLHTREEYPGTGIGLSICKRIVGNHNGQIWVESKLGNGSTFFFTLPKNG